MSYCRFGGWDEDSDVYVYADVSGAYCCCACRMQSMSYFTPKAEEMAAHLREHLAKGHAVPSDVIPAILEDGDIPPTKVNL